MLALSRLTVGFVVVLAALLAGCSEDDDDGGGGGEQMHSLSVRLPDGYLGGEPGWIIVNKPENDSTIMVRRIHEEGIVDLGRVMSNHVSLTIARTRINTGPYPYTQVGLETYVNVRTGAFIVDGESSGDPIGTASVTMTHPPEDSLWMIASAGGGTNYGEVYEQPTHLNCNVYGLDDDGTLAIYSAVWGRSGGYYTWRTDLEFTMNATNEYSLDLDLPLHHETIASSDPLSAVLLEGYRDASFTRYQVAVCDLYWDQGTSTEFDLFFGDTPFAKWGLWGLGFPSDNFRSVWRVSTEMPTSLVLPVMGIQFQYNYETREVYDIDVTGRADIINCYWSGHSYDSTGERRIMWDVWADPQSQSVAIPTLPDDILAELRITLSDLTFYNESLLWDFEPADGFNEAAEKIYYRNEPWAAMFTDFSACRSLAYGIQQQNFADGSTPFLNTDFKTLRTKPFPKR